MKIFRKIYIALIILFLVVPILYLIIFSFNDSSSMREFTEFSFTKYDSLFSNDEFLEAIWVTISIAIVSTIISTIIGTIGAIAMLKLNKKKRDVILVLTNFPLMNPEIVTALSLLLLFLSFSMEPGYSTMLLAHISFCVPYVLITVYPRVKKLDPNLIEAAMDLGCTPLQALNKVLLPQLTTAIMAAVSISFTMSFDDFLISYFNGGTVLNISTYLYSAVKRPSKVIPPALAFTTILVLAILLIFLIRFLITRKNKVKK